MNLTAKEIGTLNPNSSQRRIIYDKNYICPTLQAAMGNGGGNVPMVLDGNKNNISDGRKV